jgi:hypothetical protein
VMLDAKPVPGTRSIVASFSPGHGRNEHEGVITIVDPGAGPDEQAMARPVSKGVFYRDPYPLSEDCFLVARETQILLMDSEGRTLPIFDMPEDWREGTMKVHEPRPVGPRPRERVIAPRVADSQATGRVVLDDIYFGRNMDGVERGEIRKLLVLEILPKPCNIFSGMEPLTYGGTFVLEGILGTVPVEPDGSAHFKIPAKRPVFFVALDENDMAVKRMQSFTTVQPGESAGCLGCHETRTLAPPTRRRPSAASRPPSDIEPLEGVPDVIDFPRDIQPILDRHCLACHDYDATDRGGPMAGGVILSGDHGPVFSHSYYALTISGEFSDGRNLRKSNYAPRRIGSSASPILRKLDGSHYGAELSADEQALMRLWIDTGAAYAGTYAALGTGSIGDYAEGLDRSDLNWESVAAARETLQARCAGCHRGDMALPDSPSDNRGLTPWSEGPMNDLAKGESQRYNPVFRFNRHLLYNLTRPEQSLLLLAPLSREAGGYGICGKGKRGEDGAGTGYDAISNVTDPAYQTLLRALVDAKEHLSRIKRFDMPGFQPRPEYVREMRRYGLLPPETSAADQPIDVYALERRYWEAQWWRPKAEREASAP